MSLGELNVSLRFVSICVIDEAGIVQFETKVTAEVECIVTSLPSSSGPLARAATDLRSGLQRFEVLGQIRNLRSRQTERPLRVVGLNHRLQCWRRSVVKIRRVLP